MKNILIMLSLFFAQSSVGLASNSTYENHQVIKQQVHNYILQQTTMLGSDITAQINNIDQRLRLKKCPIPLDIKALRNELKPGRNTINVSCLSATPWRIFLTGNVKVYKNIYVAKKQLSKGSLIKTNDLVLKKTNITNVHKRYLSNQSDILNQSVKRTIQKGDLFTTQNLSKQLLIKRGDQVSIIASNNGFAINMKGIAMASGSEGQSITVKNSRTKRVVQGTVTGKATVRVQI